MALTYYLLRFSPGKAPALLATARLTADQAKRINQKIERSGARWIALE